MCSWSQDVAAVYIDEYTLVAGICYVVYYLERRCGSKLTKTTSARLHPATRAIPSKRADHILLAFAVLLLLLPAVLALTEPVLGRSSRGLKLPKFLYRLLKDLVERSCSVHLTPFEKFCYRCQASFRPACLLPSIADLIRE